MRVVFLAAMALAVLSIAAARAEAPNRDNADCGALAWYRHAQSLIRRLAGVAAPDRDGLIVPPSGIDPKMALVPRDPRGTLRIIPAPGSPGGDRSLRPR